MKFMLHLALVCGLASAVSADIVCLKNGTRLEGKLKHTADGWVVSSDGNATYVDSTDVRSIELSSRKDVGATVAAQRLADLRSSVEKADDLREIILRFRRFIDQNSEPAAVSEAKKDLATWEDRLDQKMVKMGGRWVLPSEQASLAAAAAALAEQGRQLMKANRFKDAEPVLASALEIDPQNVSALYLIASLRVQQDRLADARANLNALASLVPDHGPTLNNLAFVQWRQRQYLAAILSYDSAMLDAPVNRVILENVSAALTALPAIYWSNPIALRAARDFQDQDALLVDQMARVGLHRWNGQWIDDANFRRAQAEQQQIQAKLDAMSGDFDKSRARIEELDRNIADTEYQIHRLDAGSYVRDPFSGFLFQSPVPSVYYDLQNDDQRLLADRDKEAARLDALQRAARGINPPAAANVIQTQKMIGPEGTPQRAAISSQPSTGPAGGP